MKTRILSDKDIFEAAEIIKRGGIVALPTETVYGLAANAFNDEAVIKIFKAKGRPADNPLIVHISDMSDLDMLVSEFPNTAKKLAENFWPGPLTIILPKSDNIPDVVSAGLDTVAIRFPANKIMRDVIKQSGLPLAAPSANTSGLPSPTLAKHVIDDMYGKIDAILDGGACEVGVESTVITLEHAVPRILRPGGITHEQISEILGKVDIDEAVCSNKSFTEKPSSPGMKYRHYSPNTKLVLVKGENFVDFINGLKNDNVCALCYTDDIININVPCVSYGSAGNYKEQASKIFSALREADSLGADVIYARCPSTENEGLAVYNRLIRAAGFDVLELKE